MKFGENIGYVKLYCLRKSQSHIAYQSLYLLIFLFLSNQNFCSVTNLSAPVRVMIFKLCIHPEAGQVYCVKNYKVNIYCFLLVPFCSSLLCNAYGNYLSKISQEQSDLRF